MKNEIISNLNCGWADFNLAIMKELALLEIFQKIF